MMLRAAISPVIIEWSRLLYLCMPLRPIGWRLGFETLQIVLEQDERFERPHIVHRVRLRHPDHRTVQHFTGVGEPYRR